MNPNLLYRVSGSIAVISSCWRYLWPHLKWAGLGPLVLSSYFMHLAITGFYYAILASSWSLLAGYAGQFSFGHMAFMAIGGYTTGLIGKFIRFHHRPFATLHRSPPARRLVACDPQCTPRRDDR